MRIPPGPEALTQAWLTQALRSSGTIGGETGVASFDVLKPETERGIAGRHARLSLLYSRAEAGAPRTVFAKFPLADLDARKAQHGYKMFLRETKFYGELAGQVPLRTPRCYYRDLDMETGECVLLLEDLSGWRGGSYLAGCSAREAEAVVRELARLHAAWWESPRLGALGYAEADPANSEFFRTTFARHWPPFLERTGGRLSAELVETSERVGRHVGVVLEHLFRAPPRTLIYYDCHLDNLFFRAAPEGGLSVMVIDWQLYFVGQGAYDVAYFLAGNLEPGARRSCETALLRLYHGLLLEQGVRDYPFEALLDDYRMLLLEGLFRMVFNAVYLGLSPEQERAHLEVYAARFLRAVLDHDATALLPV